MQQVKARTRVLLGCFCVRNGMYMYVHALLFCAVAAPKENMDVVLITKVFLLQKLNRLS